ncbi:hypothetical protein DB354_09120 [Opitutus sp. ER46]|nr:hypothetical protein DB354_09120 [Opitutus sp. ER46]
MHVESVTETRTTSGRSGCRLQVQFLSDDLPEGALIWRTTVLKAIDDQNRNLVPEPQPDAQSRPPILRRLDTAPRAELELRSASRRAAAIKLVEGTAEFFLPDRGPAGIVRLPAAEVKEGVRLEHPLLVKLGIELTPVTREKATARGLLGRMSSDLGLGSPTADEAARLQAVSDEVARRRMLRESAVPELGREARAQKRAATPAPAPEKPEPAKADAQGTAAATQPTPASPAKRDSFSFQFADPNRKLITVEWQDAEGHLIPARSTWNYESTRRLEYQKPIPEDAQLVIFVAAEGAVLMLPFRAENVVLP